MKKRKYNKKGGNIFNNMTNIGKDVSKIRIDIGKGMGDLSKEIGKFGENIIGKNNNKELKTLEKKAVERELEQKKIEERELEQKKAVERELEQRKMEQRKMEQRKMEQRKMEQRKMEQRKMEKRKMEQRKMEEELRKQKENERKKKSIFYKIKKRLGFKKSPSLNLPISTSRNPSISPSINTSRSPSINSLTSPLRNTSRNPSISPSINTSRSPSINFLTSPLRSPLRSPLTSPLTSPLRSPLTSPLRSPLRSPSKRLDNFEDIKQALNNIYYEIFKVIQNETLSIIRREKKIKTTLQFHLNKAIQLDKDWIIKNFEIIMKKKNTLEESLFIISSILKAKCHGWIMKATCNVASSGMGEDINKLYKLLIETKSLPDNIGGKKIISDLEKLEYIIKAYNYNDVSLPYIKEFIFNEFNNNKITDFMKLVFPAVQMLLSSNIKGPLYIEFQPFKEDFYKIKEAYEKLRMKYGGKKKIKKKNTNKKKKVYTKRKSKNT